MSTKKTYSEKLRDPRWQKKRLSVLNRDNYTCQLCKDTTTELQIHHKKYLGNPWDIEDEYLITYCCHCHKAVEEIKKMEAIPLFAKKIQTYRLKLIVLVVKNGNEGLYTFDIAEDNSVKYTGGFSIGFLNEIHEFILSCKPKPAPANLVKLENNPLPTSSPFAGKTRKGLLDALREKYGDQYCIEEVSGATPLELNKLLKCLYSMVINLQAQQKYDTALVLNLMRLQIETTVRFVIWVDTIRCQQILEQNRVILANYIQGTFNNPNIQFAIMVADDSKQGISLKNGLAN